MESFHLTEALIDFLRRWGEMSPTAAAVLALVFIAAGATPVPRLFITLAAGVVFGMSAIPVIIPSSAVGSLIAFLLARYLFADRLRRAIREKPTFVAIMEAVDDEGWRIVALCRLASPIPSTIQNALFGLTRIEVLPYFLATLVFTIPTIVLPVYLGSVGKAALLEDARSDLSLGLMAAGGLTLLAVVLLVVHRVRQRLKLIEQQRLRA